MQKTKNCTSISTTRNHSRASSLSWTNSQLVAVLSCPQRTAHSTRSARPPFLSWTLSKAREMRREGGKDISKYVTGEPVEQLQRVRGVSLQPAQHTSAEGKEKQHARTLERLREHACCAAA